MDLPVAKERREYQRCHGFYLITPATIMAVRDSYRVVATVPSGTATSSNALLTVVAPITIANPIVSYNFDDGLVPHEISN